MKTQKLTNKKIITISIIIAILLTATILAVVMTRTSTTAYASSLYSPATFADTRSGVSASGYNILGSDDAQRMQYFAQHSFQREPTNFSYISGSQIASLRDNRHRSRYESNYITLREQSYTIQNTRYISNSAPAITFLSPGQGGGVGHWSNNWTSYRTTGYVFDYYTNSMIEQLRRETNANVYVVRANIFNLNYAVSPANPLNYTRQNILSLTSNVATNGLISLYPIENNSSSYIERVEHRRTSLRDKYRHTILVFDPTDPIQYRNFVYNEINVILTMISYDFLIAMGQVPRVNMIGFSTGGVWNMMWANAHPNNVCTVFGIGAPFRGSALGTQLRNMVMSGDNFDGGLKSSISHPSGFDNTDIQQDFALRTAWNAATVENPYLRLVPISGAPSVNMLSLIAADALSSGDADDFLTNLIYQMTSGLQEHATILQATEQLRNIILAPNFIGRFAFNVAIDLFAISTQAWFNTFLGGVPIHYTGIAMYLVSTLEIDRYWNLIFADDIVVGRSSAQANGFNRRQFVEEIVFQPWNSNLARRSNSSPAVPHNLMPQDREVIDHVIEHIRHGILPGRFITQTIDRNTSIEIVGFNSSFFSGSLTIPSHIDDLPVTAIGYSAFASPAGNSALQSVAIPYTITTIGVGAFDNNNRLHTVTFSEGSRLHRIEDNAFAFTAIENITLPSSIERLGAGILRRSSLWYAAPNNSVIYLNGWAVDVRGQISGTYSVLEGTIGLADEVLMRMQNLTEIVLPNSLQHIGARALMGNAFTTITIPYSVVQIDTQALAYNFNLTAVHVQRRFSDGGITRFGAEVFRQTHMDLEIFVPTCSVVRYSFLRQLNRPVLIEPVRVGSEAMQVMAAIPIASGGLGMQMVPVYFLNEAYNNIRVEVKQSSLLSIWNSVDNRSVDIWGYRTIYFVANIDVRYYFFFMGSIFVQDAIFKMTPLPSDYIADFHVINTDDLKIVWDNTAHNFNGMRLELTAPNSAPGPNVPPHRYVRYANATINEFNMFEIPFLGSNQTAGMPFVRVSLTALNTRGDAVHYWGSILVDMSFGGYKFIDTEHYSIITHERHLRNIQPSGRGAQFVSGNFILVNDIYLQSEWTPIGGNGFMGGFNANHNTIVHYNGSLMTSCELFWFGYSENIVNFVPEAMSTNPNLNIVNGVLFGYAVTGSTITIPYYVTHIADRAFYRSSIEHVRFAPNSQLVHIGARAFYRAYYLRQIDLPNSLQTISDRAFTHTVRLERLTIPAAVSYVGGWSFYNTPNLAITWHYNPALNSRNFRYALTTVIVPHGVTTIADRAFEGAFRLSSVTLSSTVEVIEGRAFQGTAVTSLALPQGLRRIEKWAFYRSSLVEITLPQGLEYIGARAFHSLNLTTITIPSSVTHVGAFAFYDTPNITLRMSVFAPTDNWHYMWNQSGLPIVWVWS